MNKQADTKKQIYLQERTLINGIAKDASKVSGRSASGIMEEHLLTSMLPHDSTAAGFVRGLYSGASAGLPDTFAAVFDFLAPTAGMDADARPLVGLYHTLSLGIAESPGTDPEWTFAVSLMTALAETLELAADGAPVHREELLREAAEMRYFINEIGKSHPVRFAPVICLLLSSWTYLGNCRYTFRLLSAISRIQKGIRDDAETRYEFVKIMRERWPGKPM